MRKSSLKLTGGVDKLDIVFRCQQRVRQVAKELLQQAGDAVDVVEEVFRVAEIDVRCVCYRVSA